MIQIDLTDKGICVGGVVGVGSVAGVGDCIYNDIGVTSAGIIRYYENNTHSKCAVIEQTDKDEHFFVVLVGDKKLYYHAYAHKSLFCAPVPHEYYLGYPLYELRDSGRDILAHETLKQGEPDFDTVRRILPPLDKKVYCFLGSEAGWSSICVDPFGNIYPQANIYGVEPEPFFVPHTIDALAENKPYQCLLGGYMPVLFSVHTDGEKALEFIYYIEAGDAESNPYVWIRSCKYSLEHSDEPEINYNLASVGSIKPIEENDFWDAFIATIAHWEQYSDSLTRFAFPEPMLIKTVRGTMISLATTFSADHAHYGHKNYGHSIHDNFPPSYIWAIEASCILGHCMRARRYLEHLLAHCIDYRGRFYYRQSSAYKRGASAAEYGQLLFLIDRFSESLKANAWIEPYIPAIIAIGYYLLDNRVVCTEFGGKRLIKMCAEADTNERINVYANNNLWAVRGLEALGRFLSQYDMDKSRYFMSAADNLLADIKSALLERKVETRYGPLVPFRLDYTATPLNLCICESFYSPVDSREREAYLKPTHSQCLNSAQAQADLTENTYANYRYYLEMLSSMLLDNRQACAIQNMREDLGGEFLGMTRLYGYLDDWPVAHYARYLLSTDQTEKYLLLLYAHTAHHGLPDLMCYYESVTVDGSAYTNDCIPSILTTALMTAWIFAFEPIDENAIYLLRGTPKKWFETGFSADKIYTGKGSFSISVTAVPNQICITIKIPNGAIGYPIYLVIRNDDTLREEDILEGAEHVASINRNKLRLDAKTDSIIIRISKF